MSAAPSRLIPLFPDCPGSESALSECWAPELQVLSPDGSTKAIALQGPNRVWTIGRSRQNRIRLEDPEVSGLHAEVEVRSDAVLIIDAGSSHGTQLNGTRLPVRERTELHDGDEVRVGNTVIRYVCYEDKLRNHLQNAPEATIAEPMDPGDDGRTFFDEPSLVEVPLVRNPVSNGHDVPPRPLESETEESPVIDLRDPPSPGLPKRVYLALWATFTALMGALLLLALRTLVD